MMIDIDHFKLINDTYGHLVGDEVIKAIAGRLQNSCRPESLVYRYGGEEFLCITPDLDANQAFLLAETIRKAIADRVIRVSLADIDLTLPITVSIGVAIADQTYDQDAYKLLKKADYGLYLAKNSGRNFTCLAST